MIKRLLDVVATLRAQGATEIQLQVPGFGFSVSFKSDAKGEVGDKHHVGFVVDAPEDD